MFLTLHFIFNEPHKILTPRLPSVPFHFPHILFLFPQTLLSKPLAITVLHIRGFVVPVILIGLAIVVI